MNKELVMFKNQLAIIYHTPEGSDFLVLEKELVDNNYLIAVIAHTKNGLLNLCKDKEGFLFIPISKISKLDMEDTAVTISAEHYKKIVKPRYYKRFIANPKKLNSTTHAYICQSDVVDELSFDKDAFIQLLASGKIRSNITTVIGCEYFGLI